MDERHKKVRHLLAHIPHVAIATVTEEGLPHNSPVFGAFNDKLHLFWASDPNAMHSHNIRRSGEVFVVVFDSHAGGDGLYFAGHAEELTDTAHFNYAYQLLTQAKARVGGRLGSRERYEGEGPQRLYRMVPEAVWINHIVKDDDGLIITDERVSLALDELIA